VKALAALALVGMTLQGQETPMNNRAVWFRIMPEPMPEGVNTIALEASSQFLCTGLETSADGQSLARLDGEDWQLTGDLAWAAGPGRFNVRLRGVISSGGIGDQAIFTYHKVFGFPEGGRNTVPKYRFDYRLIHDGVVVSSLQSPGEHLLGTDVAYVVPFGDRFNGFRVGGSVQLPTGDDHNWSTDGGVNAMLGTAAWATWRGFHLHAQVEGVYLGLPADSAFRGVLAHRTLGRAWAGLGYQGQGTGFWGGFGVDVTLQYFESPYKVGISYIDLPGFQQHWVFTHRSLPRWRFGFSEDMGSFTEPDITFFVVYRP
jgi:hypothetical protein